MGKTSDPSCAFEVVVRGDQQPEATAVEERDLGEVHDEGVGFALAQSREPLRSQLLCLLEVQLAGRTKDVLAGHLDLLVAQEVTRL